MIAMAGVRGHHEWRSGLITVALDTTDAATKSNSLVLPQLGISGQCGGGLPAVAADVDDDGSTGGLQAWGLQAPPQLPLCRLLGEEMCSACALWALKEISRLLASMLPRHNHTTLDIFFNRPGKTRSQKRRWQAGAAAYNVKFGPRCWPPTPVNFWQFSHWTAVEKT